MRFHTFLIAICLYLTGITTSQSAEPKMCGTATGPSLPAGTKSSLNPDGSLSIRAPSDWYFFTNNDGKWEISPSAVLRCRCETGSGGCHPTLLPNGQTFCAMDTCQTCSRGGALKIYPVNQNLEGVRFATKREISELPRADSALLSVPDVLKDLIAFKESIGIPPNARGTKVVFLNLYGYVAPMEWPDGAELKMSGSSTQNIALGLMASSIVSAPAAAVKCRCESGGSCVLESNYGVKVCRATTCATCSMQY